VPVRPRCLDAPDFAGANGERARRTDPDDTRNVVARRAATLWHRVAPSPSALPFTLSARAQAVVDHLRGHGASFYDEIVEGTGLLRTQAEEALAELVALGIATSDSFAGLRALLHRRRRSAARSPADAATAARSSASRTPAGGRCAGAKRRRKRRPAHSPRPTRS
jgi:ATP-dependent Lhr-like helicase